MRCPNSRAFSLLELLVVIAIIAILMSLAVPALGSITSSLRIAQATEGIVGQFNLARQRAMTRNRTVEARIYQLPESAGNIRGFRAIWLVESGEAGGNTAVQRPFRLPDGVVIGENASLSSLMNLVPTSDTNLTFPGYGATNSYRTIRFYPNGSTDLATTNAGGPANWYLTCLTARKAEDASLSVAPNNMATIQVVPKTGAVRIYRP